MSTASLLRAQIEAQLSARIPSALSPAPKVYHQTACTGISTIDELLAGGLPLGSITEVIGPESSGRTSFALSFIAQATRMAKVCAWIDVSNALHPESAAAAGIDLTRLLWVRCGAEPSANTSSATHDLFELSDKYFVPPPIKKGLHGGGFGPHPREEVKGISKAIGGLLQSETPVPRSSEPQRTVLKENHFSNPKSPQRQQISRANNSINGKPWRRIEQALRVTDLLLQAGGFSVIVLDMASIAPEFASRVPMATWFRYRAAAERTQACVVALLQHDCAKSSAALALRLQCDGDLQGDATVFSGIDRRIHVTRHRFAGNTPDSVPARKPPQHESSVAWHSQSPWAGRR